MSGFLDDFLDQLVEVTIQTTLTPLSLEEMSLAQVFKVALHDFLVRQSPFGYDPALAERVYNRIITNQEFIDLLSRFPEETTLDQLITKVLELLSSDEDMLNLTQGAEDIIDARLPEYVTVLQWLRTRRQEEAALYALRQLLARVPLTLRLGNARVVTPFSMLHMEIEVPTPFRDQFQAFLDQMEIRQAGLVKLYEKYFGEHEEQREKNAILEFLGEQIEAGGEWVWNAWGEYCDIPGTSVPGMPDPCDARQVISYVLNPEEFAEQVLIPLYNIFQLGTHFRDDLEAEPDSAISALAGAAFGMAGSATGVFLVVDLLAATGVVQKDWRSDPFFDAFSVDSDAFNAGMAIGEFGMGVAEMIVAVGAPAGGPLDTPGASVPVPRSVRLVERGFLDNGTEAALTSRLKLAPAVVTSTVVVTRRELLAARGGAMAFAQQGMPPDEPSTPSKPQINDPVPGLKNARYIKSKTTGQANIAYETRVTGKPWPDLSIEVNGVEFDWYIDGPNGPILLDAKNAAEVGSWYDIGALGDAVTIAQEASIRSQADRQIRAFSGSGASSIEWRIASESPAQSLDTLFRRNGIDINVEFYP